jgi:predicted transglutaminase-like cysteine proteinase
MENGCKEEASSNVGCEDEGCKETDMGCQDAMCAFWSSWDEELQKVGKLLFPPSPEGSPPRGVGDRDLDLTITPITLATTELAKMMEDTPMNCPATPTTSTPTTSSSNPSVPNIMDINSYFSPIDDKSMIPTTSQDATEKAIGDVDKSLNIGRDPSPIVIGRDPSIAVTADAVEVTTTTPNSDLISLQGRVNAFKGRPTLLPRSTSVVTSSPISSSSHKPPRSLVSSHHSHLLSGTTICASRDYDDISTIGDPDMSSPNATATVADTAAATVAAATTTTAITVSDSTSSGLCASDPSKVLTPTTKEMSSIFDPTIIKQGIHQLEQLKKQSAINEKFDQAASIKASLDAIYARLNELKRCEKSMRGAALIAEDYALAKRLQLERDVKREQVMRVLYEALKRWSEKFTC